MKSTENRATIYDVAKLAKVSAATVSRVLKGDSSVNASTYRRVEDAAAALKYERRLRQYPPQNCLIVLNVPTLNNAFYSRIISGAQDAAATEGYHVLVNAQQINEVNGFSGDAPGREGRWPDRAERVDDGYRQVSQPTDSAGPVLRIRRRTPGNCACQH